MLKSIGIAAFGGAIGLPILGVVAIGAGLFGVGAGIGYLAFGKAGLLAGAAAAAA